MKPRLEIPEPLHVLVVDDDVDLRETLAARLDGRGYRAHEAADGEAALRVAREAPVDLAVIDLGLPGMQGLELLERLRQERPDLAAIVLTGHGSIRTAVDAMKLGADDYLTKPCEPAEFDRTADRALARARLARENRLLRAALEATTGPLPPLLGDGEAMAAVRQRVKRVAPTDSTVLLTGESGTGKEVAARRIHAASARAESALVAVNVAAVPEALLDTELFGHTRGAFTGAVQARPGLFETAAAGTLFLDEVAELPVGLQAKLLRVLEDGEYRPVGSDAPRRSGARVIAATNRDLRERVRAGAFREDLLYRLEVFTIALPALREHPEDIPALVRHRLDELSRRRGRFLAVTDEALARLRAYAWPGNVRELNHVLEQASILTEDGWIHGAHLPRRMLDEAAGDQGDPGPVGGGRPVDQAVSRATDLAALERAAIERALEEPGGRQKDAARSLGISLRTLQRRLRAWRKEGG